MKNFNLAIEKGKRYLLNDEVVPFYFIATEFIFNKEEITSGEYHFEFKNNNNVFFQQILNIDVNKRRVFVNNSHEDPLIESENKFFICGQLTKDLIKNEYEEIECCFYFGKRIIRKEKLIKNELQSLFSLHEWNSKVIDKKITTKKNCIIRVHLGKNDASYYEEEYKLKKEDFFDFSQYLLSHEYVAVQCSYEEGFDLEEKHVFKGIKGIFNSSYYLDKELYIPMIPFSEKYTEIKKEKWFDIKNISQLIDYYNNFPEDSKKTFEMDDKFLINYYKENKTSSIGKLYSSNNSKIYHIDSNLCRECDSRSKCMQIVPSGLSEALFKKNIMVETFKNCSINKIINKKD